MDAVIFCSFAIFLVIMMQFRQEPTQPGTNSDVEVVVEDIARTTKLNDAFYEDPQAFTEISTVLGFPVK